ncbi:DUF7694 domain-containing protein [Desulforegula conservatrix]|uniref:DUF7694 domain-containing protein n=1 Tax=Desulforegula conservatrix TaxID=153026 RepID=UPI0003F82780|nr:hypothetical protein [Desulforegula conservatrix]
MPELSRQERKALKKENLKRPAVLTKMPKEDWPKQGLYPGLVEVWISRAFLVQVVHESLDGYRLSVCRTSVTAGGQYVDGITWEELQDIKRQVGMGDKYAIEVYPRDQDIVNVANMRHLFVLPQPLRIGWFKRSDGSIA